MRKIKIEYIFYNAGNEKSIKTLEKKANKKMDLLIKRLQGISGIIDLTNEVKKTIVSPIGGKVDIFDDIRAVVTFKKDTRLGFKLREFESIAEKIHSTTLISYI